MAALVPLLVFPWLLLLLFLRFGVREPRPLSALPSGAGRQRRPLPSVAVVIPARNEAGKIERCLASLAAQRYPDFTLLVVDDRSTDDTGDRARAQPKGSALESRVLPGEPLPPGWFGKPWACHQGARASESELLLFTDADTAHDPDLLHRAVLALEEGADAVSLKGWQELGSFGERLVQPQIFALLAFRYRRLDHPMTRARDAIANGQYILVRREAYEGSGGHEGVRQEVVEDLRFAQRFVAAGYRLDFRGAEDDFATRMYESLRQVVNGWTKNLAVGARQSVGKLAWGVLAAIFGFLLLAWILPPLFLIALGIGRTLGAAVSGWLLGWSAGATLLGLLAWVQIYRRFGVHPAYALLYPVGAGIAAWIVLRSWLRGERRIEWKGRRYGGGEVSG